MEMSCDEAVIKQFGNEIKKDYSMSLLTLAAGKNSIRGIPIAFGKSDTKSRIKNVLCYKKPTFWVIIAASVVLVTAGIGLISNPKTIDSKIYFLILEKGQKYTAKIIIIN